jgi:hypothetical protein
MTNPINLKEENMVIKDSFKMDSDSLPSETYQKTKIKPNKGVEQFTIFIEKTFLQQIIEFRIII